MDTVKSFLRGVMDVAMVIIPLSVVLGVIFGPAVPFIGADTIDNISALVSDLGGKDFAKQTLNNYVDNAFKSVSKIDFDQELLKSFSKILTKVD